MCLCFLILVVAVLAVVYFVILKDDGNEILENIGVRTPRNESIPPDWGEEDRYGIRNVTYQWSDDFVTLKYEVSDYILDDSVSYILYDGDKCRRGAKDITDTDNHLFLSLRPPQDSGPKLQNEGTGNRTFEIDLKLNKDSFTEAPYYVAAGLYAGQMTFCIGYSIIYNRVNYWEKELEVSLLDCIGSSNVLLI